MPVDLGTAELVADPDRPRSWTLLVDGTPQSHVDLDDPTHLEFEYVRWLGHLADLAGAQAGPPAGSPARPQAWAQPSAPLNVLHLGGGAWTLARYLAITRPGSRQRVVELDAALAEFVRARLPSPNSGIRIRVGEAREVLGSLSTDSVDFIAVDVFAGARIPAHLTSVEFVAEAGRVLRPGGTYAANLADGAPLAFARSQAATVSSVFTETALIGSPQVFRGRRFGNFVLAGTQSVATAAGWADLSRRTAADPFQARVVTGADLAKFVAGARVITDATALPSPPPPIGLMAL